VGQLIEAERRRAGLSQAELAKGAGLAANHVARIERGEKIYPRFDTVAKLAAQLGMSLDWLAAEIGITGGARRPPAPALRRVLTAITAATRRTVESRAELDAAADELRSALGLEPKSRRRAR